MRVVELVRAADGNWRVWGAYERVAMPLDTQAVRYVALAEGAPVPTTGSQRIAGAWVYDGYMPPAPEPETPPVLDGVSPATFISRYTAEEQVAIELVANGTTPGYTPQQRAALRVIERLLANIQTQVRFDDPRTAQGVNTHLAMGLISAERAAQILDPAWSPSA